MKEKLNLTWTGGFNDGEYYYDEYSDENGKEYFIKYEYLGVFTDGKEIKNMENKLKLYWNESYYDAEYYYDKYSDEDGNEYIYKYESVGLFAKENPSKNIMNDVDWEVVEE